MATHTKANEARRRMSVEHDKYRPGTGVRPECPSMFLFSLKILSHLSLSPGKLFEVTHPVTRTALVGTHVYYPEMK
jgi:hypothetical protein